jgi:aldose 1-epimerase
MFILTNDQGMELRAIEYGAIIMAIRAPDRDGKIADIALGFDTAESYRRNPPFFGAIVGRYANRIARGSFILDNARYQLAINNPPNHLHGGTQGFDKVSWEGRLVRSDRGPAVRFRLTSPDGDEGYPGTLEAEVTYTLTSRNEIVVDYRATTTRPTPVNLSQHTYFNLSGEGNGDILDHEISIQADRFTPVDHTLIPTGALATVDGTPFDLRAMTRIGSRIHADDEQLKIAGGFDHNFVINRTDDSLVHAATVLAPLSGRVMEVATTEPGIQFYTGNHLGDTGKAGHAYGRYAGFCLETQRFPDSPNKPMFPSSILRPGEEYRSQTVFTFSSEMLRP